MAECDCGATTTGKWAGVHHPSCALLARKVICHGDGGEGERLWGLSTGHVLTESDVADIQHLIWNYNDELGSTSEIGHQAFQSAVARVAPDKAELVERISQLQTDLVCEKSLASFYRKLIEQQEAKVGA